MTQPSTLQGVYDDFVNDHTFTTVSKNFVPGEGPVPCPQMIVGESPGRYENGELRPFIGPAGIILERLLDECMQLTRDEFFITNIFKYQTNRRNRSPMPAEISAGAKLLSKEIRIVKPKLIILCGKTAATTVFPGRRYSKLVHTVWELGTSNTKIIITNHPGAALYENSPVNFASLHRDFRKARSVLTNEYAGTIHKLDYRLEQ